MKALCWHGKSDMRYETVPDPKIQDPRDAIIKVTACAICGSDLHIYNGVIPRDGERRRHRPRDDGRGGRGRAATTPSSRSATAWSCPFTISCGECFFCKRGYLFGLRALQPGRGQGREAVGSFAGGPVWLFASAGRISGRSGGIPACAVCRCRARSRCPSGLSDDQVLFLSDIFPDRLHGGRLLQHPGWRHHRHLGLRPGRSVRDPQRVPAWALAA